MRFNYCYQQLGLLSPKELGSLFIGFEQLQQDHNCGSSARDGKKKCAICELCLDCYDKADG